MNESPSPPATDLMYKRDMKGSLSVCAFVVVGSLCGVARAEEPSPFDVRTVPGLAPARTVSGAESAEPEVIDRGKSQRRAAMWTAVGGVGLIGGSLALGAFAKVRYNDALARGDVDTANDLHDLVRLGGTTLFVAGTAAVGVAAVLYFSAPDELERRMVVTPAVGSDQLGVAISGGF